MTSAPSRTRFHGGARAAAPAKRGSRSKASTAWTATALRLPTRCCCRPPCRLLYVDEAHATGVYGPDGRGLAHQLEGRDNVIVLHTCGKALGCSGALVTAPGVLCEFLVNRCRPFIYATAPSPLMAVAATEALAILRDEPQRREELADLVSFAGREISARCAIEPSGSQILPVIVGANDRTMALAKALQAEGFDLRGIRPPTVPEGTARLRISLTLNVRRADISAMIASLPEKLERLAA